MSLLERIIPLLRCSHCRHGDIVLGKAVKEDQGYVSEAQLICRACAYIMPVINGVIDALVVPDQEVEVQKTSDHYGEGWLQSEHISPLAAPVNKWHYDQVVKLFRFPARESGIGLEGGCGHGKDTVLLSRANPESILISVDLSAGAYVTARRIRAQGISNVCVIRANLGDLPIKDSQIDWAYSFGVLHHMAEPQVGFNEVGRVLKSDARFLSYVYSDLREKPLLRLFLVPVTALRLLTRKMSLRSLTVLCHILAPFVFITLTLPARLLKAAGWQSMAQRIPYHHNATSNSIVGELYDRFGARFEYRYNKHSLEEAYSRAGFSVLGFDQVPIWRGWVSLAKKKP